MKKVYAAIALRESISYTDPETKKEHTVMIKGAGPGLIGMIPVFDSGVAAIKACGKDVRMIQIIITNEGKGTQIIPGTGTVQ